MVCYELSDIVRLYVHQLCDIDAPGSVSFVRSQLSVSKAKLPKPYRFKGSKVTRLDYHSSSRTETCGLGLEMELGHPELCSALSSLTKYLYKPNINKKQNPDNQVQSCFASRMQE